MHINKDYFIESDKNKSNESFKPFVTELEGLLMSIDGVRVVTEQDSDKVARQNVTTDLTILTQDILGNLRENKVSFPGVVLPDSIGHEVAYRQVVGLSADTEKIILYDLSLAGGFVSATLTDKDSGRKYSGNVKTKNTPKEKPMYYSMRENNALSGLMEDFEPRAW